MPEPEDTLNRLSEEAKYGILCEGILDELAKELKEVIPYYVYRDDHADCIRIYETKVVVKDGYYNGANQLCHLQIGRNECLIITGNDWCFVEKIELANPNAFNIDNIASSINDYLFPNLSLRRKIWIYWQIVKLLFKNII